MQAFITDVSCELLVRIYVILCHIIHNINILVIIKEKCNQYESCFLHKVGFLVAEVFFHHIK